MFDRIKSFSSPRARPCGIPLSTSSKRPSSPSARATSAACAPPGGAEAEFSDRRVTPELMIDFHQASEFPRSYYRMDLHVAGPVDLSGRQAHRRQHRPAPAGRETLRAAGPRPGAAALFWGACHFLLSGEPKPELRAELIRWFEHWIDIEDERPALLRECAGSVHNASMSGVGTSSWSLDIDFGSAPTTAFIELIQLIQAHFQGQVLVETVWANDDAQPPIN